MRNKPQALMLFAAGFGTRMGPLTRTCPKPLIRVAGKPLIDHALDMAGSAGIGRIVVNTHYLADQIEAHLAGRPNVTISSEQPDILETGGGLRHALPKLGHSPVFTLNPDGLWTGCNPLTSLAQAWDDDRMDALLLIVPRVRAIAHAGSGDFNLLADGRLARGTDFVYTGAQILRTDRLGEIDAPVFSLNRLWNVMLADGRLCGLVHQESWCDIGHPAGISAAEAMLKAASDV